MKYVRIVRRVLALLGVRWRQGALMVALTGMYAIFEGFGISLLLPVLEYAESGGAAVPSGGVWPYVTALAGALGLPVTLATLLLLSFVPILLRQGAFFLNTWYTAAIQNHAVERLTARVFGAIVEADLSFIDSEDQGMLLSLVTGQSSRCGVVLNQMLRLLAAAAISLTYVLILAVLSWRLAIVSAVAMLLISVPMKRILQRSRRLGTSLTDATVRTVAAVRERLAAVRLVKLRNREAEETAHVRALAAEQREAGTKIALAGALVEVIVDPALMLAVFIIVFTGIEVFSMSLAGLGLFLFVLLRLNGKVKELNVGRQAFASHAPALDWVESALEAAEYSRTIRGGAREFSGVGDGIEFRDVHFTYPGSHTPVLDGVSLSLPRGTLTGIVGRSGSGKSTLADLIPRLKVPTSGEISIDGHPIEEYDLASLRRQVGFLGQDPVMFNDTIRANIGYGLDSVPEDADIRRALEASHSAEFVDQLAEGVETVIGDRGVRLSGGQRQRLALARVFLQRPEILILDEPTSALDSESEQFIQHALERLHGEVTLLVIAHRLATVETADQILVLADGRIVEAGTHDDLLARGGHYERLFASQIRA
ncbi:MAG: ATP-binding cassette domain-containing protein [Aeromicrobium sp.]|nr:ATP-binding cassette domain-containing protein [Aeromicrobium sp.]